jgi:cardiolipin synthase
MAYPEMIQFINSARRYIVLSSYIFDYDSLGRQFVEALAHNRGVIVNVLLDGIGVGYSWHKSDHALKKLGVKTARFLPAISLTSIRFMALIKLGVLGYQLTHSSNSSGRLNCSYILPF